MVAVFEFVSAKDLSEMDLKDDRFGADVREVTRFCRQKREEVEREIEDRMILRQLIGNKRKELLAILHDRNTTHNPTLAIIDEGTTAVAPTPVPQLTLVEDEEQQVSPPPEAPKKRGRSKKIQARE